MDWCPPLKRYFDTFSRKIVFQVSEQHNNCEQGAESLVQKLGPTAALNCGDPAGRRGPTLLLGRLITSPFCLQDYELLVNQQRRLAEGAKQPSAVQPFVHQPVHFLSDYL